MINFPIGKRGLFDSLTDPWYRRYFKEFQMDRSFYAFDFVPLWVLQFRCYQRKFVGW